MHGWKTNTLLGLTAGLLLLPLTAGARAAASAESADRPGAPRVEKLVRERVGEQTVIGEAVISNSNQRNPFVSRRPSGSRYEICASATSTLVSTTSSLSAPARAGHFQKGRRSIPGV